MIRNQGAFTRVVRHLLKQKEPSLNGGACAYRGDNGLKCAIGCLIKDKHYSRRLEGKLCWDDRVEAALRKSGVNANFALLEQLQTVHDFAVPADWLGRLRCIADNWNLKMPRVAGGAR